MFKKSDEDLTRQIHDPVFRAAAIIKLTRDRKMFLWITILVTLVLLATELAQRKLSASLFLVVLMHWTLLFKTDSDLRLLRVIDLLQKDNKSLT